MVPGTSTVEENRAREKSLPRECAMRRIRLAILLCNTAALLAGPSLPRVPVKAANWDPATGRATGPGQAQTPQYEVYAISYAVIPDFPVSALVAGADRSRKMDIEMMFWLIRGPGGKNVIVDCGFYRDKFLKQWKPRDFIKHSEALAKVALKPDDITDIIISHIHWDHADGMDLFPRATVWIQKDEYL